MKLTEIQDLIKFVSKSGVNEVELETKEIKIVIKTGKVSNVAPSDYATSSCSNCSSSNNSCTGQITSSSCTNCCYTYPNYTNTLQPKTSKYITIKSPMIGTFYRSSSQINLHLLM
jgi:acetyl-CoA carboxylase biotin carboxyl carrier protein